MLAKYGIPFPPIPPTGLAMYVWEEEHPSAIAKMTEDEYRMLLNWKMTKNKNVISTTDSLKPNEAITPPRKELTASRRAALAQKYPDRATDFQPDLPGMDVPTNEVPKKDRKSPKTPEPGTGDEQLELGLDKTEEEDDFKLKPDDEQLELGLHDKEEEPAKKVQPYAKLGMKNREELRAAVKAAGGVKAWREANPELAAKLKESFWLEYEQPITEGYAQFIDNRYRGR
jgi:hypothetical protein